MKIPKLSSIIAFFSLLFLSPTLFANEPQNQEEFYKQLAPYTPESDSSISVEKEVSHKGLATTTGQIFSFNFVDWEPNSLHWRGPSNLLINSDGSWFMYAKHLANMRRTGGFLDTGRYYTFLANVTYYSGWDGNNKQCKGSVLHSKDYVLKGMKYKVEMWDVTAQGTDSRVSEIASKARCAAVTRWMR